MKAVVTKIGIWCNLGKLSAIAYSSTARRTMANLPIRTLEILSMALAAFLREPANEARFNELDLVLHVTAAKWAQFAVSRRAGRSVT
jgi:hypothetical protein